MYSTLKHYHFDMEPETITPVRIGQLTTPAHLDAAVDLQRTIWGYNDVDIESRTMLVITSKFVGELLGAFAAEKLVGVAVSFYTQDAGRMHSHRVGVLPEYQNSGVGRMLKLAQRDGCLARGIQTLEWTFDPLQTRNAHFNITRLGGVARTFIPDLYGRTNSPLHGCLPTDRLLVEWQVDSPRVDTILSGKKYQPGPNSVRITLPPPSQRWSEAAQACVRQEFLHRFAEGYTVTDFSRQEDRDFYLLENL